jgi:hypothetical protein
LLERLRDRLVERPDLVGIYVYGSLVTGDFSPARSDIDVVVMLAREPDEAAVGELGELHGDLAGLGGAAGSCTACTSRSSMSRTQTACARTGSGTG